MSWMPEDYVQGLVSVIVPTFNRAHMIFRALDSVFAQTYRPIELIVVDDGSTDDTQTVLSAWSEKHRSANFIIKLVVQSNRGAQFARNRGLRESYGEYIQFLDSDDELIDTKLAHQTRCLKETAVEYCYARTEGIDENGRSLGFQGAPRQAGRPWIAERAWHTSSPLLSRRVCLQVGPWNESLRAWQDYEYSARIKAAGFDGIFLNEVLCRSYWHGEASISTQGADIYVPAILHATDLILSLVPGMGMQARIERNRIAQHLISAALRYSRQGEHKVSRDCLDVAAKVARGALVAPIRVLAAAARYGSPRYVLEFGWAIAAMFRRIRVWT